MNSGLRVSIVYASACRCGARIGQQCRTPYGVPVSPHPNRQARASARYPEIAAKLATIAAEQLQADVKDAERHYKLGREQLETAAQMQGALPLKVIASRLGVSAPTLRKYLKEAGLYKRVTVRGKGNPRGRPFGPNNQPKPAGSKVSPPAAAAPALAGSSEQLASNG